MDDGYFDEFVQAPAYKIVQASWELFSGLTSAIDLDEEVPASFRVAITISATTGHSTLEGSVFVDDEELVFTEATRLTNETDLTELPEIVVSGLDCNILIECISTTGELLYHETEEAITVVVFPKTTIRRDPSGSGSMETNYNVYTKAALKIGDQIRYTDPLQGTTINIYVKDIGGAVDLEDNSQPFRVLYCA
jgi:hypothetical protein